MAARKLRAILGGGRGEPPDDDGWAHATPELDEGRPWSDIARNAKGAPLATEANIGLFVSRSDEWSLRYDEFGARAIVESSPANGMAPARPGELDEYHVAIARNWLALEHSMDAGKEVTLGGLVFAAKQRWYDPLKNYIRSLEWDGVPRVETWLHDYLGVKDPAASALGRMWLISGIARALEPGCKVDYMLVLLGGQGARKTSAMEALCADTDWFQPDLPKLDDKDAMQALQGAWIVNSDEMNAMRSADRMELAKNYLTRRWDRYRAPYARTFTTVPRRCIFVGTSNAKQILHDPTGNRRFWCVEVGEDINAAGLREVRDQIWAEARSLYEGQAQWWPDRATEAAVMDRNREQFTAYDEWQSTIEQKCALVDVITVGELLSELRLEAGKWTPTEQRRVVGILTGMKWEQRGEVTIAGKRSRAWRRREGAAAQAPAPVPVPTTNGYTAPPMPAHIQDDLFGDL